MVSEIKIKNKEIESLVQTQRDYFLTGETYKYEIRKLALKNLLKLIRENENLLLNLLEEENMHKPRGEAFSGEIGVVAQEIKFALKNLKRWSRPKKVRGGISSLIAFPSKSTVTNSPRGICLLITPWNYPFLLTLIPLASALAAGNTVIIKPSEFTPRASEMLQTLLGRYFDQRHVSVVLGEAETAKMLIDSQIDFIMFIGGNKTGKLVYEAASKNLTPVALELGGKSPVIVDETSPLKSTAKRIIHAKYYNSGQSCVAPDYILVKDTVQENLLEKLRESIHEIYEDKFTKENYAHIVNARHFERIKSLLTDITEDQVAYKGDIDEKNLLFEPYLIKNVLPSQRVMTEEIFGPILPLVPFATEEEAIRILQSFKEPLALYSFTKNKEFENNIFTQVKFGNGVVNDAILQFAIPGFPIGGCGQSGFGYYGGYEGFQTFSYQRSILKRYGTFDFSARFPPFTSFKTKFLRIFWRY